jgi:hypothetical protein
MKKKLVIALIMMVTIWGTWSIFQSAVGPVVATDAALLQMENTTAGHVVSRGYLENIRPMFPVIPCIASLMIFVWIAKLFIDDAKEETEKEKTVHEEAL